MNNNNDPKDLIIRELQGDMPIVDRPYQVLAEKCGLTEEEVIATIAEWQSDGLMRRMGAVLSHHRVGYVSNAMVVWKVQNRDIDRVGELLAGNSRVSHCYWRLTPIEWPYDLFTMIHARSKEELDQIIRDLADLIQVFDYKVIRSVRELKKTSVSYRR